MTSQTEEVVNELAAKLVGFYVTHDHPFGHATVPLTSQEVVKYAADPVGYLANHYLVSREEYLEWHRSGYKVICSGFTKSGKPCRAIVKGLTMVTNPAEWARGKGGRCTLHG